MVRNPEYDQEPDEVLEDEEEEEEPAPVIAKKPIAKKLAPKPAVQSQEVSQERIVRVPVFESPAQELFYNSIVALHNKIEKLDKNVEKILNLAESQ